MSFSTPRCCICLESEDIYISCSLCNDGNYCKQCVSKLVEEDKYQQCSICRREEWYKNEKKTSSLMNNIVLENKQNVVSLYDNPDTENLPDTVIEINTQENNDIVNNCTNIKSLFLICILSFIGWWLLFGIRIIEIKVEDDYKIFCEFLISISFRVALLLGLFVLLIGSSKLYNIIKDNEHINCCNFIVAIVFIILTTILGYCLSFKLFGLHENYTANNNLNYLIILLISFLSGFATYITGYLIMLLNLQIYKCCETICGEHYASCICNPIFILCVILLSTLFTYLGWLVTFDLCSVKLNVNQEDNSVLKIIISYFVGNSIILGLALCMGLIGLLYRTILRYV